MCVHIISHTAHPSLKNDAHMLRQKLQYKNRRTGTSLIRESEAAQADSLYHISRTQYTWLYVRYIFHIYTSWQIKKSGLCAASYPTFVPPHGKWIQSNGDVHVCKHWNCMEELLSPLHFFSSALLWWNSTAGVAWSWGLDDWLVRKRPV